MAKAATKTKAGAPADPHIQWTRAIKGFDADLKCRGFQYEIGGEYRHAGKIEVCRAGFHVITGHPLAVFDFYAPAGSRFGIVEIGGETASDDGVKTCAEILRVGQEVGIAGLVAEAVDWVTRRSHPEGETATGDRGAASATGYRGAASATGYQGAASATGVQGAASATGYQGAASATGVQGAASATGVRGAASATGDRGAASATGDLGAASATGVRGAASATGVRGAAMASGINGRVMGAEGNALFAVERKEWNGPILSVACGIVGRDGIKAGAWYACRGGQLVEA